MPVVLLVLALAVFVQATSEFMLAGLVTAIAADLAVPIAAAGALTSAFAVGMVVGAPLTAVLARRLPPRPALVLFLTVFLAVHLVGAVAGSFWLLAATRVLAAFANAGFLAVALVVAVRAVPADRTARATAVLLAGTSLALVVGVPAGAVVGEAFGWRATFLAVAALALLALVGTVVGVPATSGSYAAVGRAAVLRRRPVVVTLLAAALVNGGTFAVYPYVGPMLTTTGGLPASAVPLALGLFGVGAFVGVVAAGRIGDAHPGRVLGLGGALLALGWVGLALLLPTGWPAVAAVAVLGGLGFAVGSTAIARSLALAAEAGTLGGAVATAALNLGATVGPLVGGMSLALNGSGPAWIAALAMVPALALLGLARTPSGTPRGSSENPPRRSRSAARPGSDPASARRPR